MNKIEFLKVFLSLGGNISASTSNPNIALLSATQNPVLDSWESLVDEGLIHYIIFSFTLELKFYC